VLFKIEKSKIIKFPIFIRINNYRFYNIMYTFFHKKSSII